MSDFLFVLVCSAGAGLFVWAFVPTTAAVLGLTIVRFTLDDDPSSVALHDDDADMKRKLQSLRNLGFRPVGSVREQAWLFYRRWYWRSSQIRLLAAHDGSCYALLYRLSEGVRVRVFFETHLSEEGRVATVLPGVGLERQVENRLRVEVQGVSVEELYSRHLEHVRSFTAERQLDVIKLTPAERTRFDEKESFREFRSITKFKDLYPIVWGFSSPALLVLGLLQFSRMPEHSWNLALAVLAGGVNYYFLDKGYFKQAAKQIEKSNWSPRDGDEAL